MALPLADIRREAAAAELAEVYFNESSKVISFAPRDAAPSSLARLNVYYTTGTVGTCLEHPKQGKTQLFRRNVSMSVLRQLLRTPRLHTGEGYHRVRQRRRREDCSVCLDSEVAVAFECGHVPVCRGCADQRRSLPPSFACAAPAHDGLERSEWKLEYFDEITRVYTGRHAVHRWLSLHMMGT